MYFRKSIPFLSTQILSIVLLIFLLGRTESVQAQFSNTTTLTPALASKNTADKPQSKVWKYDGKWWSVFPNSSGTWIWRLDGTTWTGVLKLTTGSTSRADCKVVGNVVHVFLWRKEGSTSQLYSVEYVPASATYKLWPQRTSITSVTLEVGTETGTIDIDTNGRMWLTSDATTNIMLRYSDYPYSAWSAPIVFASGVTDDDISAVIAMPNQRQIGILWSNQSTKRFGFKVHNDDDPVNVWSSDEAPGASNAFDNVGAGLGDDHINLKYSSDGSLYAAVKTSYDTPGYTKLGLFKRSSAGVWSDLYPISETGTRAIVVLNEATRKLKVVYCDIEDGGSILYEESSMDNIGFGQTYMLLNGTYSNPSSSKDNYTSDILLIASTVSADPDVVGVLGIDAAQSAPAVPTLVSPADLATNVVINPLLTWNASQNASTYRVQISTLSDFSSLTLDQNSIASTSYQINGLAFNTTYYWRVLATNANGSSAWSTSRSFTTVNPLTVTPVLAAPANQSTGIAVNVQLSWNAAVNAATYNLQVSELADFSSMIVNQSGITATSYQVNNLNNNSTYFWRVQASNQYGNSSWSSPWSFTTIVAAPAAPLLADPANGATGVASNPLFSWSTSTGATSYALQVSTASNFSSFAVNQSGLSSTSYQANSLDGNTTYYWRVQASNAGGSSAWSSVSSFTTIIAAPSIPTLSSPADLATNVSVNPTLNWNVAANASTYDVQVAASSDFSDLTINLSNVASNSAGISGLTNVVNYFWRVRSVNAAGTSAWSQVWSFTTVIAPPAIPTPTAPAPGAVNMVTNPLFTWDASANASSYALQVSTSSSFNTFAVNQSSLNGTSYQSAGLANNTTYYWRVQANNAGGSSGWSSVNNFTTIIAAPGTPTLVNPANNSTSVSQSPTLSWNPASNASSYNVQVSTLIDFSSLITSSSGVNGTSLALSGLSYGTTYYWRVQSSNVAGTSAWSAVWKFTTLFEPLPNQLVAYYKMDEGSGSIANDNSGLMNTATLISSPTWVAGVSGSAVRMSGLKQYGSAPDAPTLDITQAITLAAWVRPEKTASQVVMKKGSTSGEDGYEITLLSTGKIQFRINQNTTPYSLNSNALYPANGTTWMHIAATYDGITARVYINGVLNKTTTFASAKAITANSQPLLIGAESAKKSLFQGALDELRIYNYSLSASEISAIATIPPTGTFAARNGEQVEVLPETTSDGQRISFYPNPVDNQMVVDFAGEDQRDVAIGISDAQGRVHLQIAPVIENDKAEINLGSLNLNSGVHLLIVRSHSYKKVFKFIKK